MLVISQLPDDDEGVVPGGLDERSESPGRRSDLTITI
jgi:hypothetical protein